MATISKALKTEIADNICQGDVFTDVQYVYIDSQDDNNIEIIEFIFPMAIIVSQACDVISMGEMITTQSGKATKFMPSILMCPIYDYAIAKKTEHLDDAFEKLYLLKTDGDNANLFKSEEFKVAKNDWHYRYHSLTVEASGKTILDNAIIDFKHYFTVPASYLMKNRDRRIFRVDDLYAEQITLKFSAFLSRVAIPD